MSQNFFKKVDSGTYINMITYRSYSLGYNDFNKNVEYLKQKLITSGFKFEKVEVGKGEPIEAGDYTTELGLGETVGGVVDKTEEV